MTQVYATEKKWLALEIRKLECMERSSDAHKGIGDLVLQEVKTKLKHGDVPLYRSGERSKSTAKSACHSDTPAAR